MKVELILVLLLVTINSQAYDVDNALGLLQSLKDDSQSSLDDLDSEWFENSQLLMENVASLEESQSTQTTECQNRENLFTEVERQQQENKDYLMWISNKIAESNEVYNAIYESRCQANRNYITAVGKQKLVLELIAFLRGSLVNVESVSLMQKKELNSKIFAFVQFYKNSDLKGLLQLKNQLKNKQDDEPVVAVSADLQPGKLTGEAWITYRDSLLALLDQIEQTVTSNLAQSSLDEINAGLASASFRGHLEGEIQQLDRELYKSIENISFFEARVVEVQNSVKVCHSELERVNTALDKARNEYATQLEQFTENRQAQTDELEVFEFVLDTYTDSVYQHADSYREAVDDFAADGQLDGTYQERNIEQIDFINPQ